ncbi:NAD-dependent succinate-semialdehyde dehydrogenase [Croceiramulus getboli]|nr:NAD-dependent succinate-semialdehyde dehydrogenase [Flavobacteriaceae bacterium YJPT1-3]
MITTVNPYTGENLKDYKELSSAQIDKKLQQAAERFQSWRQTTYAERAALLQKAAAELKKNKEEYAKTMTEEMGKPITQSRAEIEKCAWVCEYYAETAESHLADRIIETDASKSYVSYEPIGVVLAVMPWNYPYWQVFRFIAPALMAGNIGVLKHASSVMGCGEHIERIFDRAGFPKHCFQNLVIGSDQVEGIIKNPIIKAVTLTGSKPAGSAVASTAAAAIKKSVLELGGSNALVVLEDADLDQALDTCVQARFQNTGQSCIAGKRLLLHEAIADEFLSAFAKAVTELKSGDPMEEDTYIGVMAREDLAKELEQQMQDSIDAGAEVLVGGHRMNAYFEPTILDKVTPAMSVFKEETFGPLIGVTRFSSEDEAVDLVNQSDFGLGVSIFTQDQDRALRLIPQFEDGAVFVNELVKSDPRLPFGGTKISGYGRELSLDGIQEFVNKKTVYLNF